jgi:hypothetical protein
VVPLPVPQDYSKALMAGFTAKQNQSNTRYPDIAAPGADVTSYRAPNSGADLLVADDLCDDSTRGSLTGTYVEWSDYSAGTSRDVPSTYPVFKAANGTTYVRASGTSQSAALVAGAAALMVSKYRGTSSEPYLTPDVIKQWMKLNARSIPYGKKAQIGDGAIDLKAVFNTPPPWLYTQTYDAVYGGASLEYSRGGVHAANPNSGSTWNTSPNLCVDPADPASGTIYDGTLATTTTQGELAKYQDGTNAVSLCGEQGIFGNTYTRNHSFIYDAGTPTSLSLTDVNCALTSADQLKTGSPMCTGERWLSDSAQYVAVPELDPKDCVVTWFRVCSPGNYTSYNFWGYATPLRGFHFGKLGDPVSGTNALVWPKMTWAAKDWTGQPWTMSVSSPIVWSNGSWSGSWASGSWRDEGWESGSWRSGSWRAGSWRAGSWRAGSWRDGAWR